MRKFHGTKVLGTFAPEERKFQGCESSMERNFLIFSLPGSESSTGAKVLGKTEDHHLTGIELSDTNK